MLDEIVKTVVAVAGAVAAIFGLVKIWGEAKTASQSNAVGALEAAADEWRELKDDYRQRLSHAEERIDALRDEQVALSARITLMETTERRLVGWVGRLHQGITDGTIPPLPPLPDWLSPLLQRRHDD